MYKASANTVLPTSIIGSLPRPSWYSADGDEDVTRVSGNHARRRAGCGLRNFGITSRANISSEPSAFSGPYHGG